MKFTSCLIVFVVVCAVAYAEDDKYTAKYDDIDVDEIISNKRLLQNYAKCLLDQGPCTKEGDTLKGILPDGLATGCSKCTDKQKENTVKIFKHLEANEPETFKQLEEKYDPEGEYKKKHSVDSLNK